MTLREAMLGLACALSLGVSGTGARAGEPAREVTIHAKRFQFTPDEVKIRPGETVKLQLTSEDVVHGFFSRALGIDTEIEPGKTKEVVVTPREAGRYPIICHHFCGSGHGNMKMTLVVE
jgi:cytochrome c oxidase subunit 2